VQQLMDLKQVIVDQSKEISDLTLKLKNLTKVKLRSSELFEGNDLFESFQMLMKEKDVMIAEILGN
jgi:hypothetical protein